MASYKDLTEDDIRKVRNSIVSLGQQAIGFIELGGADSTIAELMKRQNELKDLVQQWEDWQKIKNCKFSDLI